LIITFEQSGNAPITHIKSTAVIDPQNPPQEMPKDSVIARVVEVKDKDAHGKDLDPESVQVVVQLRKDENLIKFFSQDLAFITWSIKYEFKPGQVIRIPMEWDNRHADNRRFEVVP